MNTEDIVERTGIAREAHGATMKGPLLIIPGVLGMFYSVGTKSNIPNFGSSARSRPRAPLIVRLLLNHVSVSSSSLRWFAAGNDTRAIKQTTTKSSIGTRSRVHFIKSAVYSSPADPSFDAQLSNLGLIHPQRDGADTTRPNSDLTHNPNGEDL